MIRAAVVEDEPECREQIRDMIQDYAREFHKQIETSVFADGQELLEAPGRFDLLLLDIEMPKLNGIETFEQMQKFSVKIPVIFLTASGDKDDVMNAIKLGAVNYLKKPYYPQELLKRIAQEFEK